MSFVATALAPVFSGGFSVGTALQAGGAALAGLGQVQASRFQAQVATNNAVIEEENARRAIAESAIQAQEQDIAARGELGALLAMQGASGLDLGSGSFRLVRQAQEGLAAQDRARIRLEGDTEASQARQRASTARAESEGLRRSALFGLVSTGLDVGTSLISGATQVRRRTANRTMGLGPRTSLRPRLRPVI